MSLDDAIKKRLKEDKNNKLRPLLNKKEENLFSVGNIMKQSQKVIIVEESELKI